MKPILISNILHLPCQSRRTSTLSERVKELIKEKGTAWPICCPSPSSPSPRVLITGVTPTWSQQMISAGERGKPPELPAKSALGKRASWARADIQFPLVYAIEGRTVWKGTDICPQPQMIMEAECETEASSASVSQRLPLPLMLPLSTWANDNMAGGWVGRWLHRPIRRAMPSTGLGSRKELPWLPSEPVSAPKIGWHFQQLTPHVTWYNKKNFF